MHVLHLVPAARFDLDEMFDSLKGQEYQQVLVLTIGAAGQFKWFGDLSVEEANFLIDRAKAWLLKDDTT
jgi:hypothetical protein